jgi:Histidine kinase-, DNA gyrase B-, and HSP90-like ATPase
MVEKLLADARPEKRLFLSLITRDISLVDAFLDIIDNSINAALEPLADDLKTADDYQRLLANSKIKPKVQIEITVGSARLVVSDNAPGISATMAQEHVFKFGRATADAHESDRLSVYGIGLKRAMFKCGNKINMISDHREGGFELKLDARKWAKDTREPWTFPITTRPSEKTNTGTRLLISELHDDVIRRIGDGLFLSQLRDRISRTYSAFIGRVVDITLNNHEIPKETFDIANNFGTEKFKTGAVSCAITAGFASATGAGFRDRNAGWFVFCNGRAVVYADKSTLTGWGGAGLLPIFQPKHRPFLGTVFFVSANPEALPWTTTKASVNEESAIWQEAKRHMVKVGRLVVAFLDKRYTESGTEFTPADLQDAARGKVNVLTAAVAPARSFSPPSKPKKMTTKIQYNAAVEDIKKIETYLRRPGMGGSAVGRYTFRYFLKNEVGEA